MAIAAPTLKSIAGGTQPMVGVAISAERLMPTNKRIKEAMKFDDGKLPYDLWSVDALEATAEVLALGAAKYKEWNWADHGGFKYRRPFAALMRHLWAWWRGEDNDSEWGKSHLAHAMCCLMFLLHYEMNKSKYKKNDDRPKKYFCQ